MSTILCEDVDDSNRPCGVLSQNVWNFYHTMIQLIYVDRRTAPCWMNTKPKEHWACFSERFNSCLSWLSYQSWHLFFWAFNRYIPLFLTLLYIFSSHMVSKSNQDVLIHDSLNYTLGKKKTPIFLFPLRICKININVYQIFIKDVKTLHIG